MTFSRIDWGTRRVLIHYYHQERLCLCRPQEKKWFLFITLFLKERTHLWNVGNGTFPISFLGLIILHLLLLQLSCTMSNSSWNTQDLIFPAKCFKYTLFDLNNLRYTLYVHTYIQKLVLNTSLKDLFCRLWLHCIAKFALLLQNSKINTLHTNESLIQKPRLQYRNTGISSLWTEQIFSRSKLLCWQQWTYLFGMFSRFRISGRLWWRRQH